MSAWEMIVLVLVGMLTGTLSWLGSRAFVRHYEMQAVPVREERRTPPHYGGIPFDLAAVMAAFAAFALYAWQAAPYTPAFVAAMVVTALLTTISLVDLEVRRIPNKLVLALLAWAVIQALWLGQPAWPHLLLGMGVGGGVFLVIAAVGRGAMGMGDVKLVAALGAVVGFPAIVSALLWGVIAGGVAALVLILARRIRRKDYMAYGPYLALGGWAVFLQVMGMWPW